MMKTLTAALFAGVFSTAASAATLDFIAEAANNERGVANGAVINFDGLNVTFNATDSGNEAFAYFDDLSSGRPAGLGVCVALTASAQCVDAGDDNLRSGEELTLSFDQTIEMSGFVFHDHDHNPLPLTTPSATLMWAINGGALQQISFADAVASTLTGVNSITFGHSDEDYYISVLSANVAAVPLPAGFLLLGSALGGFGLTRRKTKKT